MKNIFKLSVLIIAFISENLEALASDNAFYITLSNQISRRRQLEVAAHNVANSNTVGYEAESVLFNKFDIKESSKKHNSFVVDAATYKSEEEGALQRTNRTLDLAIAGENAYFKVQTPRGNRYTLNGSLFISPQGVIVTASGYPYLSPDNQPIVMPEGINQIQVTQDGMILGDGEEVGQIGVFLIPAKYALIKEGEGLSRSRIPDVLADNYMIIDNTLRLSNVNPTRAMTHLIELQRSLSMSSTLMSEINNLQKSAIQKISK